MEGDGDNTGRRGHGKASRAQVLLPADRKLDLAAGLPEQGDREHRGLSRTRAQGAERTHCTRGMTVMCWNRETNGERPFACYVLTPYWTASRRRPEDGQERLTHRRAQKRRI